MHSSEFGTTWPVMNEGYTYIDKLHVPMGTFLLDFYVGTYPDSGSRQEWSQRFMDGRVTIDGTAASVNFQIRHPGVVCEYRRPPWTEPDAPYTLMLLHEDEHVVAVHKPSGLQVLPGGLFCQRTVLTLLQARYGAGPTCPAPVHRLGRGTSGVLLCARTSLARRRITDAIMLRTTATGCASVGTTETTVPDWSGGCAPAAAVTHQPASALHHGGNTTMLHNSVVADAPVSTTAAEAAGLETPELPAGAPPAPSPASAMCQGDNGMLHIAADVGAPIPAGSSAAAAPPNVAPPARSDQHDGQSRAVCCSVVAGPSGGAPTASCRPSSHTATDAPSYRCWSDGHAAADTDRSASSGTAHSLMTSITAPPPSCKWGDRQAATSTDASPPSSGVSSQPGAATHPALACAMGSSRTTHDPTAAPSSDSNDSDTAGFAQTPPSAVGDDSHTAVAADTLPPAVRGDGHTTVACDAWLPGALTTGSRHTVRKIYRTLVAGSVEADEGEVAVPIGQVPYPGVAGGLFAAKPQGGKAAHSAFKVLERRPCGVTLMEVEIFTGRPHQIRIHMAALGHPLVGDPLYGVGGAPLASCTAVGDKEGGGRPGDCGYVLHSHQLHLSHPTTHALLRLVAPPPRELLTESERTAVKSDGDAG